MFYKHTLNSQTIIKIIVTIYHQKILKGLYVYSNVGCFFFPNPEGILCIFIAFLHTILSGLGNFTRLDL